MTECRRQTEGGAKTFSFRQIIGKLLEKVSLRRLEARTWEGDGEICSAAASGFGRNKWPWGDWLIARSTHLDQLDQLISATGIWKEQMARTYTSWSIYQCSVSHSRRVSSQKTLLHKPSEKAFSMCRPVCLCELPVNMLRTSQSWSWR